MSKQSNPFQNLVFRIHQALAGTASVEESALVREKNSESKREIDVLITATIAGYPSRVAIECRDHSKDQDITWVDALIGKYVNLPIDRVIAVSATPFFKDGSSESAAT